MKVACFESENDICNLSNLKYKLMVLELRMQLLTGKIFKTSELQVLLAAECNESAVRNTSLSDFVSSLYLKSLRCYLCCR